MTHDAQKKNKNVRSVGPGIDCNCQICIFTKSQAPGNPYNIKDCPKYNSSITETDIQKIEIKLKTISEQGP